MHCLYIVGLGKGCQLITTQSGILGRPSVLESVIIRRSADSVCSLTYVYRNRQGSTEQNTTLLTCVPAAHSYQIYPQLCPQPCLTSTPHNGIPPSPTTPPHHSPTLPPKSTMKSPNCRPSTPHDLYQCRALSRN